MRVLKRILLILILVFNVNSCLLLTIGGYGCALGELPSWMCSDGTGGDGTIELNFLYNNKEFKEKAKKIMEELLKEEKKEIKNNKFTVRLSKSLSIKKRDSFYEIIQNNRNILDGFVIVTKNEPFWYNDIEKIYTEYKYYNKEYGYIIC